MKLLDIRYNEGDTKLRQAVAVLPWSHNLLLMNYNLSPEQKGKYKTTFRPSGTSDSLSMKHLHCRSRLKFLTHGLLHNSPVPGNKKVLSNVPDVSICLPSPAPSTDGEL